MSERKRKSETERKGGSTAVTMKTQETPPCSDPRQTGDKSHGQKTLTFRKTILGVNSVHASLMTWFKKLGKYKDAKNSREWLPSLDSE